MSKESRERRVLAYQKAEKDGQDKQDSQNNRGLEECFLEAASGASTGRSTITTTKYRSETGISLLHQNSRHKHDC